MSVTEQIHQYTVESGSFTLAQPLALCQSLPVTANKQYKQMKDNNYTFFSDMSASFKFCGLAESLQCLL